ncbi:hypothetical protein KJ656_01150, partial [bacterium]|nr:hypothetical protein [bacterium]
MVKDIAYIWGNPLVGNKPNPNLRAIKPSIDFLDSILDNNGTEIFKRLSSITGINKKIQDIDFFVNSVRVSLHNTGQRFVSISLHHPLDTYPTIIIHELFHIFFHDLLYSGSLIDKLDEESIVALKEKENEIKEYLTIIINEEFSDLI